MASQSRNSVPYNDGDGGAQCGQIAITKIKNTVGSSDKVKPSPSGEGAGQTKKLRIAICRFLV